MYNILNINNIQLEFLRDTKKDLMLISPLKYAQYAMFDDNFIKGKYLNTEFRAKDKTCYIKLKNNDLWLYDDNNGGAIFKTLGPNIKKYYNKDNWYQNHDLWYNTSYNANYYVPTNLPKYKFDQPIVFWISYDATPLFHVYKIDNVNPNYLIYTNNTLNWTTNVNLATRFKYDNAESEQDVIDSFKNKPFKKVNYTPN